MKLTIASLTSLLLSLILSITIEANEVVKYSYKQNSNQAYVESYWRTNPCIDYNSFSLFASDGFVKASGSKKEIIKSVSGSGVFYSNCDRIGATRTELSFYSTEPVTGLRFSQLTNVTIATNLTTFYSKSQCIIQSYEYPDEFGEEESIKYYVCGDEFDSGTGPVSIDTIIKLSTNFSSDYTSINKGVSRGPGYISKYESKSRCKTAVPTKNVITFDEKIPIVFSTDSGYSYSEICKAQSGSTERIMFT
jgi:hypothetical protein